MKFLAFTVFLLIASGLYLHYKVDISYLGWIGKIPGDIVIKKKGATIYFPIASSLLVSVGLSLLSYIFFPSEKK